MTHSRPRTVAAVVLAAASVAWLDPDRPARDGNRLFAEGKYDDAATKYNEALVDRPDSPLLHFNLGDAAYKQGKYADALAAFTQVATGDADPVRAARVAYNMGNAKYRLGEAAETSDAKSALGLYAEALALYRRAMGAAPDDLDAKFNHEFVAKKMADLRKKLEEQQKQQEQQQQNQQPQQDQQQQEGQQQQQDQQQQQGQQQQEGQQQENQQAQDQQGEKQQADDQPQKPEAQPSQDQQQGRQAQAGGTEQAGEKKDGAMSPQEAAALIDSQRDQEVRPDEVVKKLHGAVVAGPAEDW